MGVLQGLAMPATRVLLSRVLVAQLPPPMQGGTESPQGFSDGSAVF